jgi:hypothetical protein
MLMAAEEIPFSHPKKEKKPDVGYSLAASTA